MTDNIKAGGYHMREIPRGDYGHLSKIYEEILEAMDAEEQDNKLMVLLELSDIIAAIEGYLVNHADSMQLEDLIKMARATTRAFLTGARK